MSKKRPRSHQMDPDKRTSSGVPKVKKARITEHTLEIESGRITGISSPNEKKSTRFKAGKLYDALLVGLADPERELKSSYDATDPRSKAAAHQLKNLITEATIYELDDEFTSLVQRASYMSPMHVAYLFSRAMAPHDVMWVEWNTHARTRVSAEWQQQHQSFYNIPEGGLADEKGAYLIERDTRFPGRDTVFRVTAFALKDGEAMIWPVGIVFDPDPTERPMREVMSHWDAFYDQKIASLEAPSWRLSTSLGHFWLLTHSRNLKEDLNFSPKVGETVDFTEIDSRSLWYITNRAAYCAARLAGLAWYNVWSTDEAQKRGHPLMTKEGEAILLDNSSGDLRFISSLLGMMNTYDVEASQPRKLVETARQRFILSKKVPFLEYRILKVKYPRTDPLKRLRNLIDRAVGRPKRWHSVRGFWRHYSDGRRKWIASFGRGDPKLGMIIKNYKVFATQGIGPKIKSVVQPESPEEIERLKEEQILAAKSRDEML